MFDFFPQCHGRSRQCTVDSTHIDNILDTEEKGVQVVLGGFI